MSDKPLCHEDDVEKEICIDRWSKDLVGTGTIPTTSGFSIGVAVYTEPEFGERQRHADQEAVYVVSGVGEILIGEKTYPVKPGSAAYIAPGVVHATRRTTDEPVKVVYAHGPV
ncbi:MAG TPA: cupin domain-containing protein [Planctomycetota bacterium]|nr:cupin domain-containing protein [Planctomycetota bacterium]